MSAEERSPISKSDIPFLSTVQGCGIPLSEVASRYLRVESKQAELRKVKEEIALLRAEGPSFDELSAAVLASFERYQAGRAAALARYLKDAAKHPDCFARFEQYEQAAVPFLSIQREVVEQALELLRESGYAGLPEAEKRKEIASLEKKQKKLLAEIDELLPPDAFMVNHPQSNARVNAAEIFFESWRNLQCYTTTPCCFRGISLREADEETQKAHAVLGLSGIISRAARVAAFTPPATVR